MSLGQPPSAQWLPNDRALHVEHGVIWPDAQFTTQRLDFVEGPGTQRAAFPTPWSAQDKAGRREAERGRGARGAGRVLGLEQRAPARSTTQSMIHPGCAIRSAVTAGSACRMSPMAPRRTTSKRKLDCVCKVRFSHRGDWGRHGGNGLRSGQSHEVAGAWFRLFCTVPTGLGAGVDLISHR